MQSIVSAIMFRAFPVNWCHCSGLPIGRFYSSYQSSVEREGQGPVRNGANVFISCECIPLGLADFGSMSVPKALTS